MALTLWELAQGWHHDLYCHKGAGLKTAYKKYCCKCNVEEWALEKAKEWSLLSDGFKDGTPVDFRDGWYTGIMNAVRDLGIPEEECP